MKLQSARRFSAASAIILLACGSFSVSAQTQRVVQTITDSGQVLLHSNESLVMTVMPRGSVDSAAPVHVDFDWTGFITGAGPGGGPHVKIFNGSTGVEIQAGDAWTFTAPTASRGVTASSVRVQVRCPREARCVVRGQTMAFDPATGGTSTIDSVSLLLPAVQR